MENKMVSINIIGKVPPPIGGVTIHTLRLYQWLKKEKSFDVKLSSLNKHDFDDKGIQYTGNYICWSIKKLLFGFSEDIVHYQGANFIGLLLLSVVKWCHPNFKLVWSIHSEYLINRLKNRTFFNFALTQIDKVIVDNSNIQTQLIAASYPSERVDIVSPFLMPDDYDTQSNKWLDEYKANDNVILLFNAYKLAFNDKGQDIYGFDTLLRAYQDVSERAVLVLLIPSINSQEKEYYNEHLNKLNESVRDRIVLISDTSTSGWKYINSCDIFVRPTITDGDALSVKEALYMDKPTIVSDCTVRPSNTILFKNLDSSDLAVKINSTIEMYKPSATLTKEDNIIHFTNFYKLLEE